MKLTVINEVGKEALVAILGPGDFFGQGSLAGQSIRMGSATAITPTTVLVIEKNKMYKVFTRRMTSPTGSSSSCWHGMFESKRTWSISNSIRARSGWPALFYCLRVMAKRTNLTE
ncbi:MAG: Crp/Fnr family transcriptional regulator [Candidatus Acidiferrales bacterium]